MHSLLYRFSLYCVEGKIISQHEVDWLVYGLEKRITTTVTSVFFFLIGMRLANTLSVVSFLISFYFLRVRTNGYHANSFLGCLLISLILEIIFLTLVLPVLNTFIFILLNLNNLVIIFLFAPFANLNMHLDEAELSACRRTSRIRIIVLFTLSILFYIFGEFNISRGILLGSTMAAFLLIIAYIKKGENKHEERKQSKQEDSQVRNLINCPSGNE